MFAFRQQTPSYHLKCNILSTRAEHKLHKIHSTVLLHRNPLDSSTIVMPFHENRKCKSSPLTKTPFTPLSRSSATIIWNSSNTVFDQKAKPDLTTLNSWCIIENCHVKVLRNLSEWPNSPTVQFLRLQWSCAGNHLSSTWPSAIIYVRLHCVSSRDKCQHCRALKNKEKYVLQ